MEPTPGRSYAHFKGGRYTVCALAEHTETGDTLVIYRSEADGRTWARPLSSWTAPAPDGAERFVALS